MIKLSIIIVLYNEFDLVRQCIRSVYEDIIPDTEIILVDNNSEKKGVKDLLKKFSKIRYIKNKKNLGFSRAANIGFINAKGKFLLLLTPDTILVRGTIISTVRYIANHQNIALVGCRVYSEPKRFHLSAFHSFPNLLTHLFEYNVLFYKLCRLINKDYHPAFYSREDHRRKLLAKHIIGAYLLLRAEAGRMVNFFDERYFMYREETDLCKRLCDSNWKIVYLPIGGLIHYSNPLKLNVIAQCLPHYQESTYMFFKKHYGFFYALVAWMMAFISSIINIPILAATIVVKKIFGKDTQSEMLLGCFIKIFRWHIESGLKVVFFKQ